MSTENGNYVTRAELSAHITPLKADVAEVKGDVKTLLGAMNQARGEEKAAVRISDRKLAYAALIAGLLAPMAWAVPHVLLG